MTIVICVTTKNVPYKHNFPKFEKISLILFIFRYFYLTVFQLKRSLISPPLTCYHEKELPLHMEIVTNCFFVSSVASQSLRRGLLPVSFWGRQARLIFEIPPSDSLLNRKLIEGTVCQIHLMWPLSNMKGSVLPHLPIALSNRIRDA